MKSHYDGSTAFQIRADMVPTGCGFFHDHVSLTRKAWCATFSNGSEGDDISLGTSGESSEPEAEDDMNDQDGHDGNEAQESEMDFSDDEYIQPTASSGPLQWVVYRPNRYSDVRRLFCILDLVGPGVGSIRNELSQCWDLQRVRYSTLRLHRVHDAALTSDAAFGRPRVYLAEFEGDGRSLIHQGDRLVLIEVLKIFNGNLIEPRSKAHYVIWRGSPEAIFHSLIEAHSCYDNPTNCLTFRNGAFIPWRSICIFNDGDFVQLQIVSDEIPQTGVGFPAFSRDVSLVDKHMLEVSQSDADDVHHNLALRAFFVDRPPLPNLEFSVTSRTSGEAYTLIFSRFWHDLDNKQWRSILAHPSTKDAPRLSQWDQIHLIDHEDERTNGHALVLIEQDDPSAPSIRAEWLICCASRDMFILHIDRDQRCSSDVCTLSHNGAQIVANEVIALRHGDYLALHIESSQQNQVGRIAQQYNDPWGACGVPEWIWVVCIDALVFFTLCLAMIIFDRPASRRLVVASGARHSVRIRSRSSGKKHLKSIIFSLLVISGDAGPIFDQWLHGLDSYDGRSLRHDLEDEHYDNDLVVRALPWIHHGRPIDVGISDQHGLDLDVRALPWTHNDMPTDVGIPDPPDLTLHPLPLHPRDVQGTRRPRARLRDADHDLLTLVDGNFDDELVVLETYGLYDGPVGTRTDSARQVDREEITRTIRQLWIDYSAHFDTDILLVRPQPQRGPTERKLYFVVRFVDYNLDLPETWRPVLVDQMVRSPMGVGVTTIRAAAFLDSPCSVVDVFHVVRVAGSCPPHGIRPCMVRWHQRDLFFPDRLAPRSGDFLVVNIETLQQYFAGTEEFFIGARRFALDGHRAFQLIGQDDILHLWVHAVSRTNEPLGFRPTYIQRPDLLQPERLWHRACNLWGDKHPGRDSFLVNVQPQPLGTAYSQRIHVVLVLRRIRDLIPVLFLTKFRSDTETLPAQNLEWRAKHCPGRLSDMDLLQCSGVYPFFVATGSDFAVLRANRQLHVDEVVQLRPGDHVVLVAYLPSIAMAFRQLWDAYSEHVSQDIEHMSLLQRSLEVRRGALHPFDPFSKLPPPGNGAIVDLSKSFDKLDDCSFHEWGVLIFDCDDGGTQRGQLSAIQIDAPDLSILFESILSADIRDFPIDLLVRHLDSFDLELQPRVQGLACEKCVDPVNTHIYTDGSYDSSGDGPVGWGFVAITCGSQGFVLEHLACGYIDSFCPILHGHAVTVSARTGEIEALIQATLWSIASLLCLPFNVYYDAISVGHSATGLWNHNPNDKHLRILRALMQFAEKYHEKGFVGNHVYAHSGIFGNEIANFMANYARLNAFTCGGTDVNLSPYTVGDRMPLEWLWLRLVPYLELEQSFPIVDGATLSASCHAPGEDVNSVYPSLLQPQQPMQERNKKISVGLATYNVGSLQKQSGGRPDDMAPQEYLRRQAQAHGLTCLFLQETRAKQSGLIESATHIRLVAESANGHGGTEIWLAKVDDRQRKTGISTRDVLVLHVDSQIVLARVSWPFGKFLLLSAHSPHSGRSHDEIQSWWTSLASLVGSHYDPQSEWLLCGVDANAHFDEAHLPWIGDHGLEHATNFPGECFLAFLQQLDICVPSTFEHNHKGVTTTWRNHDPTEACRCDYLCVPTTWRPTDLTSYNIPTLDAGTSSMDHVPVALWCNVSFVRKRKPRPTFDREAIAGAYEEHGHALIDSLQGIPWSLDVHRHGALVSEKTRSWLETFCPLKKNQPRATFIKEETWHIRKCRLDLARQLRHAHHLLATNRLQAAFLAWRFDLPLRSILHQTMDFTWSLLKTIRRHKELLRTSRNALRRCIRRDRTAFLESVAQDAICDHPNALHRHLRRAGVQSKNRRSLLQPLPCLKDLEGKLVTSFADYAETWRKQFELQEDGVPCSHEKLYRRCLDRQVWDGSRDVPPDWTMVPTLTELEQVLRQTKIRKAFFDDVVPGEILHYAAKDLSLQLYPLLLKQWLFRQEPVLFKGGLLVSAFKKGDPSDTNNYRSLLISPTIAKAFHRLLRGDLMKRFETESLPMQLGGRPGISVTQAAHVLHDFLHHRRVLKLPTAVVFLDIRNAFYRLFRQQLVKCGTLERTVDELFTSLGLPDQARGDFHTLLVGASALDDADVPQFWQGQVRELLNGTWFTVSGTPILTEARKGSRPGDSAADLLFSFAFRHLLKNVTLQAADLGVVSQLTWSGERVPHHDDLEMTEVLEFLGPIWADDVAILLESTTSAQLVRNTQIILGLLFDQLVIAGMSPNLGKSKTEILFDLRGKDSVALRKHFALNGQRLPTVSKHLVGYVNIVGSYKHLGTWVQVNGKLGKELSCRFGIGHATMTKYRSAIFSNRKLPLVRKTHLFQSLVMSAVLFNAPAWYLQRKKDLERYHSGVMALYRRLAAFHFGPLVRHWRDELVQARLSLPSPVALLHLNRLRYLQHLVRQGDSAVWAALQQHCYWWQMVDLSLDWLKMNAMLPLPETPVSSHWSLWYPHLSAPGGSWKSLLRRAILHSTLQTRKSTSWHSFHQQICQFLVDEGYHVFPESVVEWDQFACVRCRQSFRTCSAWSVHAFRKHGRTTMSRLVAKGDVCSICLKKFHDHAGLVNHLTNNPDCFWQLRTLQGPVEKQPSLNSRVEVRSRTELRTPVHRVWGPRPPRVDVQEPPPLPEQQEILDEWDLVRQRVQESTSLSVEEMLEDLRKATMDTILPIHEIHYLASAWRQRLHVQGAISLGCTFDLALDKYITGLDARWLLQDQALQRCAVTDPETIFAMWTPMSTSRIPVDRPLRYKQIIVAHLFSGRRRPGDLQEQLEKLSWPSGTSLLTLSVDIIFSESWGNLLRPGTLQLFLRACREGLITAMVAGPPCETWSIARLRGLYGDNGPRPLRNADHLQGFSQLSIREAQQVCLGNELLGVALVLAMALWAASGLMILEHPAEPGRQPNAASIWRTRVLRYLLSRPRITRIRVLQGLFGAVSAKPTDLLVVSPPPALESIFRGLQTCQTPPTSGTIGKDRSGHFKTAALKEYPAGFCNALAHVILAHVWHKGCLDTLDPCPEDVIEKFGCLIGNLDQTVERFGPDFHPVESN